MKYFFNFSSLDDGLRGMMLKLCLICLLLAGGSNLSLQANNSGNAVENTMSQGSQQQKDRLLRGKVTDKAGDPLPGVAVQVKGTSQGVTTNADGEYYIMVKGVETPVLVFTFVGMETQEVSFSKGKHVIDVVMQESQQRLDEVVVTGIFKKAKESYTGAVTTVTKDEILAFRGQNLLQTLRSIDPAFNIVENNEFGSDPNRLPDITVRGSSSLTTDLQELNEGVKNDLNVPLIIMDGFEISLTKLMDYNDEEIESINILKDAAATAIYGSRGANGVVLITTKKGTAGKTTISFDAYWGSSKIINNLDLMSGSEWYDYQTELNKIRKAPIDLGLVDRNTSTDWMDEI